MWFESRNPTDIQIPAESHSSHITLTSRQLHRRNFFEFIVNTRVKWQCATAGDGCCALMARPIRPSCITVHAHCNLSMHRFEPCPRIFFNLDYVTRLVLYKAWRITIRNWVIWYYHWPQSVLWKIYNTHQTFVVNKSAISPFSGGLRVLWLHCFRLHKRLYQSRSNVRTAERNRCDSKDILWAFVFGSRIAQNCAFPMHPHPWSFT